MRLTHDNTNRPTPLRDRHTISAEQTTILLKSTHDPYPNLGCSNTTFPLRMNPTYANHQDQSNNTKSITKQYSTNQYKERTGDLTRFSNLPMS